MGYKKKWNILNTEPELQHLKMSGFFDFKPLKHRFHLQKNPPRTRGNKISPPPPPSQHY